MSKVSQQGNDGLDLEVLRLERELLLRGREDQQALLSRPDMLSPERAEALTGISEAVLMQLRIDGQVLGLDLPNGRGECKFPAFQFEPEIRAAIPEILLAFGRGREWNAYDFLTLPEPLLGGKLALDELRAGRRETVTRVVVAAAAADQGAY